MRDKEPYIRTMGIHGASCPIAKTLDVIGAKWTFFIIRDLLHEDTMRFNELMNSMEGISPKTLSLRLRQLVANEIVERRVYPGVPPHVEYKLSKKGLRLEPIFRELEYFGLQLDS
jgi:DNA-binding HxlR family transcriptional regulator